MSETDGWTAADVKAEVGDDTDTSPVMDTLEPVFADAKEWVPYQGPQGGEGWENTETGERVYGEKPDGGDGDGESEGETETSDGGETDPPDLSEYSDDLPDEYDGDIDDRFEMRDTAERMAEDGIGYSEVVAAFESGIGGMDDEARVEVATHAYAYQSHSADIGGEEAEASPILRTRRSGDKTEFREAAESALPERLYEGEYGVEPLENKFKGWVSMDHDSVLNQSSNDLWTVAVDETGNDNLPDDATAGLNESGLQDWEREDILAQKEHTTELLRETFGDTIPVVRGFGGEFATQLQDAKESGESVELDHRTLESWSSFPDHSQDFARGESGEPQGGAIIYREVPVEDVWGSSHTTPGLDEHENEFVVGSGGAVEYDADDIYSPYDERMKDLYDRAGKSWEEST